MSTPDLTLITPTFQSAATLSDTLESVLAQTYTGTLEYWVIDGGSTDGTLDLLARYAADPRWGPQRRLHWISEPDRGLYDAMNKGLARATGEVIGVLNSDDFYAQPEVLAQVMAAFADPRTDAVYGDLAYVHAQHTQRVVRRWKSGAYRRDNFHWGWMPPHPTFFVRRRHYLHWGGFDLRLRLAADYEWMLRLLFKHRLHPVYLPQVLVKMRTGGISNASWRHRWQANREDRLAWKLNGLRPYFFTTYLKPLRKLGQWV